MPDASHGSPVQHLSIEVERDAVERHGALVRRLDRLDDVAQRRLGRRAAGARDGAVERVLHIRRGHHAVDRRGELRPHVEPHDERARVRRLRELDGVRDGVEADLRLARAGKPSSSSDGLCRGDWVVPFRRSGQPGRVGSSWQL